MSLRVVDGQVVQYNPHCDLADDNDWTGCTADDYVDEEKVQECLALDERNRSDTYVAGSQLEENIARRRGSRGKRGGKKSNSSAMRSSSVPRSKANNASANAWLECDED